MEFNLKLDEAKLKTLVLLIRTPDFDARLQFLNEIEKQAQSQNQEEVKSNASVKAPYAGKPRGRKPKAKAQRLSTTVENTQAPSLQ